jgi:hypothetical protein
MAHTLASENNAVAAEIQAFFSLPFNSRNNRHYSVEYAQTYIRIPFFFVFIPACLGSCFPTFL